MPSPRIPDTPLGTKSQSPAVCTRSFGCPGRSIAETPFAGPTGSARTSGRACRVLARVADSINAGLALISDRLALQTLATG